MASGVSYGTSPSSMESLSLDKPKASAEVQASTSEELINKYNEPTILAACREGKVEIVRRELANDPGAVNSPYRCGKSKEMATLLFITSQEGHADVAQVLIKHGADIEIAWNGTPPLFIASQEGHADVVQILLENGASPVSKQEILLGVATSCLSAAKREKYESYNAAQKENYEKIIAELETATELSGNGSA